MNKGAPIVRRTRASSKHALSISSSIRGRYTLAEILSQPVVWGETIEELERQRTLFQLAEKVSPLNPWLFVACGSSYYLAQVIASFWSRLLHIPCLAVPASEVLFDSEEILHRANPRQAVLLSRSGETTEVLRAAERLKTNGSVLTIGATCNASSPLEDLCSHMVKLTSADEKSVVMTRSFTAFVLAFQRLGAMLARNHALLDVLDRIPANVAAWLGSNQERICDFGAKRSFADFVFLGQGAHYWLAQEGALKMTEMSSSYAQAYHTLEFRHGPRSIAGRQTLITFLISDVAAKEESILVKEVKDLGAATCVVANRATPQLKRSSDLLIEIALSEPEFARLAATAIPAQLLGCAVALRKGLNPDRPNNLTRFVELETYQKKGGA